jgi:hypothetical protein
MHPTDLAWLAGLLEGEGTFLKPFPSAPRLVTVRVSMTDRDVVARAASLMGVGIASFRPKNPKHRPVWIATAKGTRARELMVMLKPLMGERRQSQIDAALTAAKPYRPGDGPKLSFEQATEIRLRFSAGERAIELAAEFGVSKWLVYRIYEGKRAS